LSYKIPILAAVALFASMASAQVPTSGNVFFGYSHYSSDLAPNRGGLNGWEGTLEGKVFPHVGIVADLSGDYGSLNFKPINVTCVTTGCPTNISTHVTNVIFGPRVSVSVGKFRPFAEVMAGVGHASASGFGSDTSLATAVGGGLDYRLLHFLGWRFELDYLHTSLFSRGQSNGRIGTGIVFNF
jgi:hypothetical protein